MTANTPPIQESSLYSFKIASADLKYIEINTREIYLRKSPSKGPYIRGELPGCGSSCHVNLTEIFLEYAMSCQGCTDSSVMRESVVRVGARLGGKIASVFQASYPELPEQELLIKIIECTLNSMDCEFQNESRPDDLHFIFTEASLDNTASNTGLQLWSNPAFLGFVSYFESILATVNGNWRLLSPKSGDRNNKLSAIRMKKEA
jgi:hypothetical protein